MYVLEKIDDTHYVCTDNESLLQVKWEAHKFNETQKMSFIDEKHLDIDANKLAGLASKMGDWLACYHYNTIFPYIPIRYRLAVSMRIARESRGLSVEELADMARCKPNTIRGIESAKFTTGYEVVEKILEAMGVSLNITEF